jgi:hypothetical protein
MTSQSVHFLICDMTPAKLQTKCFTEKRIFRLPHVPFLVSAFAHKHSQKCAGDGFGKKPRKGVYDKHVHKCTYGDDIHVLLFRKSGGLWEKMLGISAWLQKVSSSRMTLEP